MLFNRLRVYDRYIPSLDSINFILSEIENESDRFQFVKTNNTFHLLWCVDIETIKLLRELIHNYREQGEVVGEDAIEFIQSLAVVNWFAAMVAKMKEGNIQGLGREASNQYDYFKETEYIELDKPNPNFTPRYSDLKRFDEYEKATKVGESWYEKVSRLSNDKPELRELIIHERWLIYQIIKNRKESKNLYLNQYLNKCCFCQRPFQSYWSGGRKTCGSPECEQKYNAAAKRKSRSQPHEIAKRAEPPKAFDGVKNFCDECENRRVLRKFGHGNFCKPCCQTVLKIW